MSLNKTLIEWVKNPDGTPGFTWNPITGCLNHVNGMCQGGNFPCYAYRLANGRLKNLYLANKNTATQNYDEDSYPFYPRFWPERMSCQFSYYGKKAQGIFVCDMADLFGLGIPERWTEQVLRLIGAYPQHRFYLLTKQPQNLPKWSPFPDNVYLGVTVTNQEMLDKAIDYLKMVDAKVKYLSIEPLLGRIDFSSYIGYNEPIDKEDENVTETQRRDCLPSSGTGRIGDRRVRSDMESQKPHWDTLGKGRSDNTMPEAPGRKRHGEISPSQGNGGLEENTLLSPSLSLEALSRADTRGNDYQSQKRRQEGQQASQFRDSKLFGEHDSYVGGSSQRTSSQATREQQCNGEVNRRSRSRNQNTFGRNTERDEDSSRSQDSGIGHQIRGGLPYNLGCDTQQSLELNLIIIGAQTKPYKPPRIEWVKEIVVAADKAGVAVFLKDNIIPSLHGLRPFYKPLNKSGEGSWELRQEMPQ